MSMPPESSNKEQLEVNCRRFIASVGNTEIDDATVGRQLGDLVPVIRQWVITEIQFVHQGMPSRIEHAQDLDDIIQEVLLRLAGRPTLHQNEGPATAQLRSWVKTVAGNLWRDIFRKNKHAARDGGLKPAPSSNTIQGDTTSLPSLARSDSLEIVAVDPDTPETIIEGIHQQQDYEDVVSLILAQFDDNPRYFLLFSLEVAAARQEQHHSAAYFAEKLGVSVSYLYQIRHRMYEQIITNPQVSELMSLWGIQVRP